MLGTMLDMFQKNIKKGRKRRQAYQCSSSKAVHCGVIQREGFAFFVVVAGSYSTGSISFAESSTTVYSL